MVQSTTETITHFGVSKRKGDPVEGDILFRWNDLPAEYRRGVLTPRQIIFRSVVVICTAVLMAKHHRKKARYLTNLVFSHFVTVP